ncbi:hypothetical protein A3H11_04740 [Candidatus Uhrbacteria bacterium RIFCSPLOWO2_12_FULL_47_10]|nr:MAG: hypothetical protein A3H11_04740 [Candidatus Uhrbacteria bacterium RIFCSPLOWO2_12_FULL_47_10]
MRLKIIQINIYRGKFLDKLVEFLRAEAPDIITMQEVTGGRINFWNDESVDTFGYVKHALGISGAVTPIYRLVDNPAAYEGNAVLVRGNILNTKIVWLKEYREYPDVPWEQEGPEMPRNVLDATVDFGGTLIHVLVTHGAWTKDPIDTPEKLRQVRLLAEYLCSLKGEPFILGGDFNMEPGSEVIGKIDEVAHNAIYDSNITNTLNLRTHRAAKILGNGRLVDFIYTSSHFTVVSIDTPQVDVSDHLPVRAVLRY